MRREEIKNLLLSFGEDDFYKNVDLHIHSNESDGKMSPYEIVEQAKAQGKKYIAICDHNTIDAYLSTNILREDIVIPAVEFDCIYKGVLIHIIGYGIDVDNKEIKSLYATSRNAKTHNIFRLFKLRNPKQVIEKIIKAGGVPVLAHPCCLWCFNLDTFVKDLIKMGLEGLEAYYPYNGLRGMLKFHSRKEVIEVAEQNNLIKTGGTDSHGLKLL